MLNAFKFVMLFLIMQVSANAAEGFVDLPATGFANAAYVLCNTTGDFGLKDSAAPDIGNSKNTANNTCAVSSEKLLTSPMNGPLEGFDMAGMISRGVSIPEPYANSGEEFATLTDTIWRNKATKECIYGTHILMKDAKLANGQTWEINDIARAGFAGKPVAIAYFFKPEPHKEYGLPEALFRAGRTFTSVRHAKGDADLPSLKNAPAKDKVMTDSQAAAVSDNWVDFTTDINVNDPDGVTRKMTAMFYIKTSCEAIEPAELEGAIRLRTTGQNGQTPLEISVPGLAPVGAVVGKY
ncbi:hypothetical protein [Methylotenera sp.]|uniref:hypothetical protein n=1 Tax=Methylotenera sp. TaxID=2051956 RepID=UPI0024882A62|nr:hypothetical protein [Methylotenera sp.]MDI1298720.1 hypothetical protein [Methylotenera sp.]